MEKVPWNEIKSLIELSETFWLTTHLDPDGDGLGAACAMLELLRALGKTACVVCDQPIPERFQFLNYHQLFFSWDEVSRAERPDVIAILDTHVRERIGRVSRVLEDPGVRSFCVDHHPRTACLADVNWVEPEVCCTGVLVFDLFHYLSVDLNNRAANGIYSSIVCDTGRFAHGCQDGRAYQVADECLRAGVDPDDLNARLFQRVSVEQVKWFAGALQRVETFADDRILVHTFSEEELRGVGEVDLEYVHEFHKLLGGVECIVLMRELPGEKVRVSIRSRGSLDIGHVMRQHGGGGHAKAAGAVWTGSIDQLKPQLVSLLSKSI